MTTFSPNFSLRSNLAELSPEQISQLLHDLHVYQAERDPKSAAVRSKQAKQALQDSEQRYRWMIEELPVGVLLQDPTAEILLSNNLALEMLGLSEEQLLGKSSFDPHWNVIHEDGTPFPSSTHPVPQAIASRQPVRNVVMGVFRPTSQTRVWLLVNAFPQLNRDASLQQVLCTFSDISDIKQAYAELHASTKMLQEAQRIARIGSWKLNLLTNQLIWSDEIFRLFEIDKTQLKANFKAFLNVVHPADRKLAKQAYTKSLSRHRPYDITHRLQMADGRIKWVHVRYESDFDESGTPIRSNGTVQDVTVQIRADEQLHVAAATFETQEAMIITDASTVILRVNRSFTRITGYSAEEAIGQTPRLLQSGRHGPDFYCQMWQAINSTGSWQGEVWDRHKNGEVHPKWLSISSIKDKTGAVSHYVGTHFDITDRKIAEAAMLALNQDLSRSRQLLRDLTAQNELEREAERKHIAREVHDELGQVLTALRLDLSMLKMRFGTLEPALLSQLNDTQALADRAIRTVRQVAANLRPIELDMGLVSGIEFLCHEFGKRNAGNCVLNVENPDIHLDEARSVVIFRIVQESLTNVARYAQASQVHISLGCQGDQLGLEIRDNGQGFDMAAVAQQHSLGLLGMRERALALGGRLDVISAPRQGTVVALTIPLTPETTRETA